MGQQVLCYHNQIAPLRTVKYDGPTKGKCYYGCSYWPNRGHAYFSNGLMKLMKLKDSKIAEVEQEMEELKQKVKRLKAKKEKL
ncbi:Protein ZGRF1 [Bienertia sinuspersici]